MKNFLTIIIILISFHSCVGSDTAFLPQNINEAKKQRLLVAEFKPSKSIVNINKSKYSIEQVFTTLKFNSKNDKKINPNFFALILVIKNMETGELGLSIDDYNSYENFIKFDCKTCGGIIDDNIVINYDNFKDRKQLDSVKISFINDKKENEIIIFTKK